MFIRLCDSASLSSFRLSERVYCKKWSTMNEMNLDHFTVDYKVTEKSFNFPKKYGLPFYFVSAADGTNVVKVWYFGLGRVQKWDLNAITWSSSSRHVMMVIIITSSWSREHHVMTTWSSLRNHHLFFNSWKNFGTVKNWVFFLNISYSVRQSSWHIDIKKILQTLLTSSWKN